MKKKIFILAFLLVSLSMSLIAIGVQAGPIGNSIEDLNSRTKIEYTPNVPIDITVGRYNFAEKNIVDGGEFLASYIVGIYTYGAGFAGIVAMLMLVIAGWKWLLAGGNAQKVTEAKNMINGVLVGLALLFGGQLLLRQISENFNSVQSLSIRLPDAALESIALSEAQKKECEELKAKDDKQEGKCEAYITATSCYADVCGFGRTGKVDDICVPATNGHDGAIIGRFVGCFDCPDRCKCSDYEGGSAFYKNDDPCDCDNDGLTMPDSDGCNDPSERVYWDGS